MTLRRLSAWLVAASLMFAGTFVTHCYVLARFSPAHHGGHAETTSVVGFLCAAPFLFSCLTLLMLGLVARSLQSLKGGTEAHLSAWPFGLLAPLGFLLHQFFSDFTGTTSLTLASVTGPAFLAGLVLQLPLGLLAYFAARGLLRVADRIGAALAARNKRTRGRDTFGPGWNTASKHLLPVQLAGARSARAPPLLSLLI